ncbi:glycosyltransferase [Telmatospirillum sp. J64-1]|uniref:glycosyltransferase n=1 Tax=Telmatospirillum sp. J64-1 TaxID=2502183 RepID=UPI00115EA385|nr:glycosyltransferase [Telmatospirillum sp. J64-1]
MNIMMMTNTYAPHVGGVARSVDAFTQAYRRLGHKVLVVAPEFEDMPEHEQDVVRVPALQHFNGSDFSVVLPVPGLLDEAIEAFAPELIHAHHPFLLGSTALRLSRRLDLPLVFTHHTMYEQYTHYVPGDSETLRRFVVNLSTSYANLCDHIFAPSESVADILRERNVETPITVIPTGVRLEEFDRGSGPGMRAVLDIPPDAFLVGHVGRLAPEKNLEFLARAVIAFMAAEPRAHFLLVGKGPSEKVVREAFVRAGLTSRLHMPGQLEGAMLASAYRAMDVFAFASQSETQGMVLAEAMAAGVPVVAVDAPGCREVVRDRRNGCLLPAENEVTFAGALMWMSRLSPDERAGILQEVRETAVAFSLERSVERAVGIYRELTLERRLKKDSEAELSGWSAALRMIRAEWDLLVGAATGSEHRERPRQ